MTVNTALHLEIRLETPQIHLDQPCVVQADLANTGDHPLRVNQRMAIGYRDSLSRELFADILNVESHQPAKVREVDYERAFPSPADFVQLAPGQKLGQAFNLFKWYLPLKPGRYQIILYYQADEPLANPPFDIVPGIYASQPVEFIAKSR